MPAEFELTNIGGTYHTPLLEGGDTNEPGADRTREKPDKCTKQQINQALMDLEDLHPLRNIVKSHHILPCLKKWKGKKGRDENFAFNLRVAILGQMKVKIPKSD
jgi:hypothetical protein